jgi:hypothetical protein
MEDSRHMTTMTRIQLETARGLVDEYWDVFQCWIDHPGGEFNDRGVVAEVQKAYNRAYDHIVAWQHGQLDEARMAAACDTFVRMVKDQIPKAEDPHPTPAQVLEFRPRKGGA